MRCKCCDSIIDHPEWNDDINDWELCSVCLDHVNTTFEDPVTDDPYEDDETEEDWDF